MVKWFFFTTHFKRQQCWILSKSPRVNHFHVTKTWREMFCCFQREGNSRPKGMDTVRSVKCVVSVHTKTLAVCWCSFSLLSVLICVVFMFGSINHFHSTLYMKQPRLLKGSFTFNTTGSCHSPISDVRAVVFLFTGNDGKRQLWHTWFRCGKKSQACDGCCLKVCHNS